MQTFDEFFFVYVAGKLPPMCGEREIKIPHLYKHMAEHSDLFDTSNFDPLFSVKNHRGK